VFLLDASASVGSAGWEVEKDATVTLIDAFDSSSKGDPSFVGAVQFSSDADVKVQLTRDIPAATAAVSNIPWPASPGATNFEAALRKCQAQLGSAATVAQQQAQTSAPTCGKKGSQDDTPWPQLRIVNGQKATPCEWGWQVSLRKAGGFHFCGGMLIDDKWVLTAAHCEFDRRTDWVVLGDFDKDSDSDANEQWVRVKWQTSHPRWDPDEVRFDFELLELEEPAQLSSCVSPVCLPEGPVAASTDCMITGWGTLYTDGPSPSNLQEAQVEIVPTNGKCSSAYYGNPFAMGPEMMCAQGINPRTGSITDACQGDSGGPLVCPTPGGNWVLQGVTSFGGDCADPDAPGVWARVSYVTDWIKSVTDIQEHAFVAMDSSPASSQQEAQPLEPVNLCVLISDGQATLGETDPEKLRALVADDTKIVGIYVGSSSQDAEALRAISSCWDQSGAQDCPYFANATDFADLQRKASTLAAELATTLDSSTSQTTYVHDCDKPWWTLAALLGAVPALAWWFHFHYPRRKAGPMVPPVKPPPPARKEPVRLLAAGANGAAAKAAVPRTPRDPRGPQAV
jgi:secreted trypsin-like serine protease